MAKHGILIPALEVRILYPQPIHILGISEMVSRVIDVVLLKTVTAIFSLHAGARIGGSIPSSPAKKERGLIPRYFTI